MDTHVTSGIHAKSPSQVSYAPIQVITHGGDLNAVEAEWFANNIGVVLSQGSHG